MSLKLSQGDRLLLTSDSLRSPTSTIRTYSSLINTKHQKHESNKQNNNNTTTTTNININTNNRSRLHNYATIDWLAKRYMHCASSKYLTLPEELEKNEEIVSIFEQFDEDKSGKLSIGELYVMMHKANIGMEKKDLENICKIVDLDHDNALNLKEFKNCTLSEDADEEFKRIIKRLRDEYRRKLEKQQQELEQLMDESREKEKIAKNNGIAKDQANTILINEDYKKPLERLSSDSSIKKLKYKNNSNGSSGIYDQNYPQRQQQKQQEKKSETCLIKKPFFPGSFGALLNYITYKSKRKLLYEKIKNPDAPLSERLHKLKELLEMQIKKESYITKDKKYMQNFESSYKSNLPLDLDNDYYQIGSTSSSNTKKHDIANLDQEDIHHHPRYYDQQLKQQEQEEEEEEVDLHYQQQHQQLNNDQQKFYKFIIKDRMDTKSSFYSKGSGIGVGIGIGTGTGVRTRAGIGVGSRVGTGIGFMVDKSDKSLKSDLDKNLKKELDKITNQAVNEAKASVIDKQIKLNHKYNNRFILRKVSTTDPSIKRELRSLSSFANTNMTNVITTISPTTTIEPFNNNSSTKSKTKSTIHHNQQQQPHHYPYYNTLSTTNADNIIIHGMTNNFGSINTTDDIGVIVSNTAPTTTTAISGGGYGHDGGDDGNSGNDGDSGNMIESNKPIKTKYMYYMSKQYSNSSIQDKVRSNAYVNSNGNGNGNEYGNGYGLSNKEDNSLENENIINTVPDKIKPLTYDTLPSQQSDTDEAIDNTIKRSNQHQSLDKPKINHNYITVEEIDTRPEILRIEGGNIEAEGSINLTRGYNFDHDDENNIDLTNLKEYYNNTKDIYDYNIDPIQKKYTKPSFMPKNYESYGIYRHISNKSHNANTHHHGLSNKDKKYFAWHKNASNSIDVAKNQPCNMYYRYQQSQHQQRQKQFYANRLKSYTDKSNKLLQPLDNRSGQNLTNSSSSMQASRKVLSIAPISNTENFKLDYNELNLNTPNTNWITEFNVGSNGTNRTIRTNQNASLDRITIAEVANKAEDAKGVENVNKVDDKNHQVEGPIKTNNDNDQGNTDERNSRIDGLVNKKIKVEKKSFFDEKTKTSTCMKRMQKSVISGNDLTNKKYLQINQIQINFPFLN